MGFFLVFTHVLQTNMLVSKAQVKTPEKIKNANEAMHSVIRPLEFISINDFFVALHHFNYFISIYADSLHDAREILVASDQNNF